MSDGMSVIAAIRAEQAEPPSGIRTLGLDVVHRWITHLGPGAVDLEWEVDHAYSNLEGAVLCSWSTALADQALFFAATTLCRAGERTRMAQLTLSCLQNLTQGTVLIAARILPRSGDRLVGTCTFTTDDESVAVLVTAVMDIVPE